MAEIWKILIHDATDGGVAFRPDVKGAKRGDPLKAVKGDLVSWTNRTDRALTLAADDGSSFGKEVKEVKVPAGESTWFFEVTAAVTYRCKRPAQTHKIVL
jgi:plastocyanin